MSVRLRLRRTGTKNKPCYRIVAADKRSPRDGRFIEVLGYYDPRREDEQVNLERVEYWISNGAQPSETVAAVIDRAKGNPRKYSSKRKKKEKAQEAASKEKQTPIESPTVVDKKADKGPEPKAEIPVEKPAVIENVDTPEIVNGAVEPKKDKKEEVVEKNSVIAEPVSETIPAAPDETKVSDNPAEKKEVKGDKGKRKKGRRAFR